MTCNGLCGAILAIGTRKFCCAVRDSQGRTTCDMDLCQACGQSLLEEQGPPADSSVGATGGSSAASGTSSGGAATFPPDAERLVSYVMLYVDNGNAVERQTNQRYFRTLTSKAVAVGGCIFPNVTIDATLTSELPTWIRADRNTGREAATESQLRERLIAVGASLDAAAAAGWHRFDRRLSRLPVEAFQLRAGHFSLAPLAAEAVRPLGRLRFEARMIEGLAAYPAFKERAAGQPHLRRLTASPQKLLEQGVAGLETLLSERGLPASWVHAAHVLPATSPAIQVASLKLPDPPPSIEHAVPWSAKAADFSEVSSALGESIWAVGTAGELDATATLVQLETALCALAAATSVPAEAVLILLTHERAVRSHKLIGGAGAEARLRSTAKSMSVLRSSVLPVELAWSLSPLTVGTLVNARVRWLAEDNPRVYQKAIIEPMKTVEADTCSNRGMLEVLVVYAERLNLPCAEIFRRLSSGFDSGKIGLEGDQLTKARVNGLLRKLAESMDTVYSHFDDLIATDPRRAQLVAILGKLISLYQTVSSFELVNGHFHMHWHGGKVLGAVRAALGLAVSSTLLGFRRFDASVPHFNSFDDLIAIDFPALRISLLDQMLLEGRLQSVGSLQSDAGGHMDAHALLSLVFAFLLEKEATGDVITKHHCAALRAEHEWLENGDAVKAGDREFSDECMAPWLMPLHKALGKFNESMLCAEQLSEIGRQSAYMRRATHVLFSQAVTDVTCDVGNLADQLTKDLVNKRATDWINERDVDMFKRAIGSFSNLSSTNAERKSQRLVFLRHLREVMFDLLGSRAGIDSSSNVPSGRFEDILLLSTMYGIKGANVWAGNSSRRKLYDAMAFAHFRTSCSTEHQHLDTLRFTYNTQFGLPEVVRSGADAALRTLAATIASTSESAAASGLVAMALDASSVQGALQQGCILASVCDHELLAKPPPQLSGTTLSWPEVVAHWGLSLPSSGPVSLTTHQITDMDCTSGSRLAPLMQAIKQTAGAGDKGHKKQEAFRSLLTRLVSDIDLLSNEYMEGMVAKSKEKGGSSGRHHEGMPSLALATCMTDEGWLSEQTANYHTSTVKPRFEAIEQRDERACELIQVVTAAGALTSQSPNVDVVPIEELMFSESIQRLRQEQTEATALQARFVDAYQRGERRELLLDYGRAALAARERANRSVLELESNVSDGIIDRTSTADVAETMEATSFHSPSSPEKLLGDVRRAAASGERKHISFINLVRRSEGISQVTRQRLVSCAKDDLAKRADATSIARTRAPRVRKSAKLPPGSVEYAQVVRDGMSPRNLHGMTVFYLSDESSNDWRRGFVSRVGCPEGRSLRWSFTLSLERKDSSSRRSKVVSLPSPSVRFLPSGSEAAAETSATPAPLPEDDASTVFGLLECEAKAGSLATATVSQCLLPATSAEARMMHEATRDPPTGVTELQVGEEVHFSTTDANDEPAELNATIVELHEPADPEEETYASVRVERAGQQHTERAPLSKLRSTGFLAQPLRQWSGGDEVVHREDARRLREPPAGKMSMRMLRSFWLNTTTVNCIGYALSNACPNIWIASMGLGEYALHRNFRPDLPRTQRMCQRMVDAQKEALFGDHKELWLFPFCRSLHIFGAAVDFRFNRIILIDSCGGAQLEPTDARRAAQLLTHKLYQLGGKGSFDWTGWKAVSLRRLTPQQGSNAVNCGVYTMACFWALANRVSLSAIRNADMRHWRVRFLIWLLDGGSSLSK